MYKLSELVIDTIPAENSDYNADHLHNGQKVAITEQGLKDHNNHNLFNTIAISTGVGLVALPAFIGGGIGLAFGGEAIGLGLAELGIIGGGTGATIGTIVNKPKTGHLVKGKHETLSFIDMVGVVQRKARRWWDVPGHDVLVTWTAKDEMGRTITFKAWHNPEMLYGMKFA